MLPSIWTLVGQAGTFLVFVWAVMKFVWPPLTQAMEERRQKIAEGLAHSEQAEQALDSARLEAAELLQPKLQRISLPRKTFESEADVDAWLDEVKQQILSKLNDGPVTF